MSDITTYEVRTDVTVGSETFPHVYATELTQGRAESVAFRESNRNKRRYYVVEIKATTVYVTNGAKK